MIRRAVLQPHESPFALAVELDGLGKDATWVRVSVRWWCRDFEDEFEREHRSREFSRKTDYWVHDNLRNAWSDDIVAAWIRSGGTPSVYLSD
jgi:hypothetical protein